MCVSVCVPVCWLSRISSERTPVSSGCPQLKEGQHSHWDAATGRDVCVEVQVHCDLYHNRSHPTGKRDIIHTYTQSQSASFINPNGGDTSTSTAANPCWTKWAKRAITPCITHVSAYFSGRLSVCVCAHVILYYLHTCSQMPLTTLKSFTWFWTRPLSLCAHMKSIPFLSLPPCCYADRHFQSWYTELLSLP